jgi:hypothetical protein
MFSRCQAGLITIEMGVDDFTAPVATMIFIAAKGHSSDDTVLMFSPTSTTRTHAHQLLNTRQLRALMISNSQCNTWCFLHRAHEVAVGTHTCAYVCQRARHVLAQGASHRECSVDNLFYAK